MSSSDGAGLRARLSKVRLLVLDVDGVLTDGSLYYGPTGESLKRFQVRDGLGIRILHGASIHVAVISARKSELVGKRMADLRIEHWYTGKDDKVAAFEELLAKLSLTEEQAAFVGDDLLDVPIMRRVGVAIAVADAHPFTKAVAHWTTSEQGGHGAVREVCDALLDAQGGLSAAYEHFLRTELGDERMGKA